MTRPCHPAHLSDEQIAGGAPELARDPGARERLQINIEKYEVLVAESAKRHDAEGRRYRGFVTALAELADRGRVHQESFTERLRADGQEILDNPAFDSEGSMNALDLQQRRVAYFRNIAEYGRRVEVPCAHLRVLEANAELLAVKCSLASERAMLSAVDRYIASEALLNAGEVITFDYGTGTTGKLVTEARRSFFQWQQASESVEEERERQIKNFVGVGAKHD